MAEIPVLDPLIRELATVLAGDTNTRINVHVGDGKYGLTARLELFAGKEIQVDPLALRHARDPAAYIAARHTVIEFLYARHTSFRPAA